MPYKGSVGVRGTDYLEYVSSHGTADISDEGLAPSTTDSQFDASATSDPDSIGESINSPNYPELPASGLPVAENKDAATKYDGRDSKSVKVRRGS